MNQTEKKLCLEEAFEIIRQYRGFCLLRVEGYNKNVQVTLYSYTTSQGEDAQEALGIALRFVRGSLKLNAAYNDGSIYATGETPLGTAIKIWTVGRCIRRTRPVEEFEKVPTGRMTEQEYWECPEGTETDKGGAA